MGAVEFAKQCLSLCMLILLTSSIESPSSSSGSAVPAKREGRISHRTNYGDGVDGKLFVHGSLIDAISFKRASRKMSSGIPLVVWRYTNAELSIGDTLYYSTDLHDAASCVISSIDRRSGVLTKLRMADGERIMTMYLAPASADVNSKGNGQISYTTVLDSSEFIGVEESLSLLLVRSLEQVMTSNSTIAMRRDTIVLCNRRRICTGFRLWVDMLRTGRIGGIVTDEIRTSEKTIPPGTVIFLIKRHGRVTIMESQAPEESEDPQEYLIGAEIARF